MKNYRVSFERIGRSHDVAPLIAKVQHDEELPEAIYHYARPHLRSRDIDVHIDFDAGAGFISCGLHNGGNFTIACLQ